MKGLPQAGNVSILFHHSMNAGAGGRKVGEKKKTLVMTADAGYSYNSKVLKTMSETCLQSLTAITRPTVLCTCHCK